MLMKLEIYGQLSGNQSGNFIPSEDHPQFKLLRNGSALMGAIIGIGYAIAQVEGEKTETIVGSSFTNFGWNRLGNYGNWWWFHR